MSAVGTILLVDDRYRLDARIATGSLGEIWRGTDLILARPVAVKLLRADYAADGTTLARFRAAAQHAGALAHENIARIYDYDEADLAHPPFLVMELVDGPSLGDLLAAGPLEPARVLDLVAQAAAGLAAAHRAGLTHRDIRPGNLLLAGGDVVKITNFGISRALGDEPVTAAGLGNGAAAYLAPERISGASGTPASDLYSLGIVAFECLAGGAPYGGSEVEVALAHRRSPLPPLPADIPAEIAELIRALTAKDPDRRPGAGQVALRAGELRDTLFPGWLRDEAAATALDDDRPAVLQPDPASQADPDPDPASGDWPAPGAVPPRGRRRNGRTPFGRIAAVGAAAIAATVLALTLTGVIGHGTGQAPAAEQASPGVGADGARLVRVNGAALRGQPVTAVRRQLRRLGLIVHVRWQVSDQLSPGQVLSVAPAGRVPAGSVVVVTGAVAPVGTRHFPGKSGGHGLSRGQHPGRHQSQSPGPGQSPPSISPSPTASSTAEPSPTVTPSGSPTASPSTTASPTAPATPPATPPAAD